MQKIQHPKIKFLMSGSQSIIKHAKKQENTMYNEGKHQSIDMAQILELFGKDWHSKYILYFKKVKVNIILLRDTENIKTNELLEMKNMLDEVKYCRRKYNSDLEDIAEAFQN